MMQELQIGGTRAPPRSDQRHGYRQILCDAWTLKEMATRREVVDIARKIYRRPACSA